MNRTLHITDFVSPIFCLNRLRSIESLLQELPPGDLVECGCYLGLTAAFLRWKLPERTMHVYDAFPVDFVAFLHNSEEGVLQVDAVAGSAAVRATFDSFGLTHPEIHAGWFEDTLPTSLPNHIAFAHIDCDHPQATHTAIKHVYPRLVQGGVCVLDDYGYAMFSGVQEKVDLFLHDKPERAEPSVRGIQAWFRKQ